MPNDIARKRLKQKMIERWENEGGKIETEPKVHFGDRTSRDPVKDADHFYRSRKNSVTELVSHRGDRKSR
jgi:hypothetical protein